ncbi:MAG: glycosyl transferase [Armatimonadota bacterium]|jgi:GT2 family glycosyltransferase|nr:MAG: glycosyl transferase [Armatimonadota bacterium]
MDLSVIIVNFNTRDLLRDCLVSVFKETSSLDIEVTVVDNASGDGSAEMVRSSFPQVQLVCSEENLGFARANNLAIPQAKGEIVVLLNPDTVVKDRALERLVEYLRAHPEVGAAGPDLPEPSGILQVAACGYRPTVWRAFCQYFFLTRLFPRSRLFRGLNIPAGAYTEPVSVEWLSGACLAAPRRVWQEVGLLDESWFMFAEDMEWCERVLGRGYELHYLPDVVVYHIWGASSKGSPEAVSTMWLNSLAAWYGRSHSCVSCAALLLILSAGMRFRYLVNIARAARRDDSRLRFEALYQRKCATHAASLAAECIRGRQP